jgi:hypothetical protein
VYGAGSVPGGPLVILTDVYQVDVLGQFTDPDNGYLWATEHETTA